MEDLLLGAILDKCSQESNTVLSRNKNVKGVLSCVTAESSFKLLSLLIKEIT